MFTVDDDHEEDHEERHPDNIIEVVDKDNVEIKRSMSEEEFEYLEQSINQHEHCKFSSCF